MGGGLPRKPLISLPNVLAGIAVTSGRVVALTLLNPSVQRRHTMPALAMKTTMTNHESTGGRLVTLDGRALPLRNTQLRADARGGLARARLIQTFHNPHAEPLAVEYQLPLPADGAVGGFAFELAGKRIVGEVDRKSAARERYEQALVEGRTAALLEQDRSSLFTQEIGNVPPGADVTCEIIVDQKLAWLAEGAWEWRFPTVVAPRYMGAPHRVPDAARVTVDVAPDPLPIRTTFELRIQDRLSAGRPDSPSHTLVTRDGDTDTVVELASESGAALDRDIVVRWSVAQPKVGISFDTARAAGKDVAYALLTLVPPKPGHTLPKVPRDLIVLLDTSGSMSGEPLEQAKRVAAALIDTLDGKDRLEMIEFSSDARRWKRGAVEATEKNRKDALSWLRKLEAGGGTEMRTGILEALAPLSAEAQRQVVLVTDGCVGFEQEIVATLIEKLPRSSRVHTVGVGSGVNRSLTAPAARAGRGLEVIIGLGEDPERAAARLVAHTASPQVIEWGIHGPALLRQAPARPADLFAGQPSRVSLELRPEGGALEIRGRTAEGTFAQRVEVPAIAAGTGNLALATLFGRERVEDLEMENAGSESHQTLDAEIEQTGLRFQISTRLTSWVAVTQDATVDPLAPSRQERVPHMLPHGMSAAGLGLRGAMTPVPMAAPKGFAHAVGGAAPPPMRAVSSLTVGRMRKEEASDKKSGTFGIADGLGPLEGSSEDEAAAAEPVARAPAKPQAPAAPSTKGGATRTLTGKTVLLGNGKWVFTFTVDRAVTWQPVQTVTVYWPDGTVLTLAVETAESTRGGEVQAGMVLRVTLPLGGDQAPDAVGLLLGAEPVRVVLD
jgi:Ca-activated chloride channel family protein